MDKKSITPLPEGVSLPAENTVHLGRGGEIAALKAELIDPTVRTFNGEPPEQFGLTEDSRVLWWNHLCWVTCYYGVLAHGDK